MTSSYPWREDDHVHLFVEYPPKLTASYLAINLKSML